MASEDSIFEGGHNERHGVSIEGKVTGVPLHRHEVSLDFTRIEGEFEYTLKNNWDFWFRVPYETKERVAEIGLMEPTTESERAAMQRNLNLHHTTDNLSGISDLKLLVAHRRSALLRQGDTLDIALGVSLPTGRTESDPFKAAERGEAHEHIQFGSGTVDPLFELYYTVPLTETFSLGGFGVGRFGLYENSKTFRGPIEVTAGVDARYWVLDWLSLRSNFAVYYQGFAHWDGEQDVNSGLLATSAAIGAGVKLGRTNLGLDVRYPLTQKPCLMKEIRLNRARPFS